MRRKVDYETIFRWSFVHPKTGKVIRPKNGRPFCIRIRRPARRSK